MDAWRWALEWPNAVVGTAEGEWAEEASEVVVVWEEEASEVVAWEEDFAAVAEAFAAAGSWAEADSAADLSAVASGEAGSRAASEATGSASAVLIGDLAALAIGTFLSAASGRGGAGVVDGEVGEADTGLLIPTGATTHTITQLHTQPTTTITRTRTRYLVTRLTRPRSPLLIM